MRVSFEWLKELVDLNISDEELVNLLPLRTIGTKEATQRFVELDMKGYNRADLLSLRGIAQEVAAITDSRVKFENEEQLVWEKQDLPPLSVEVTEPELCPVYCLAKIEGLRVDDSCQEWIQKLSDCGLRPVNNIADVTNLVMLEYGQPLHAFDADSVTEEKIIVRVAKPEEKLETLDNKTRTLNSHNLLITDPEKALGIAGVMGGKDSEVKESTTTILLEAAIFDPINLRSTAQDLNLHSEAAKRFQHGLTVKNLLLAFNKAIKMYGDLGGKLTALSLHGDLDQTEAEVIPLHMEKVKSLIGTEISQDKVINFLERLNFKAEVGEGVLNITTPYYRLDIHFEEDLIEEIARLYGYENIPPKALEGERPQELDQTHFIFIRELREKLVDLGLTEVQTYSYFSTDVLDNFHPGSKEDLIKIYNPMSKETTYLRQNLWENLVEVVAKNQKYNLEDIAIFEVGKSYSISEDKKPTEEWSVAVALQNNSDSPIDEILSISREVIDKFDLGIKIEVTEAPEQVRKLFHPKRFTVFKEGEKWVGGAAEVHPRILDKLGIKKPLAVFEIILKK